METLIRPNYNDNVVLNVTPESAGWNHLSFKVVALKAGQTYLDPTKNNEMALVPLAGRGLCTVGEERFELTRKGVFDELPHVLYVPPGSQIFIEAQTDFQFSLGGAAAEGKYPLRLFTPAEMKREVRGGDAARRQVHHILAPPLPAERLILYEVYVPGGRWSGWPPHCHDGYNGAPYLEETYYCRFDPPYGFAMHHNYRVDSDFREVLPLRDGDLALMTQGFHSTATAPNCNMYFLNYLAGDLWDQARGTPPLEDESFTWVKDNWDKNVMTLPAFKEKKESQL
jgi:5-deoxy-glucuronate isomerase